MMHSKTEKDTEPALAQLKVPLRKEDLFEQFAEHEATEPDQSGAAVRRQSIRQSTQGQPSQRVAGRKSIHSRKADNKSAKLERQHCDREPIAWTGKEPAFQLARNNGFFGFNEIRPSELVHVLAVGVTGSGKTVSAVTKFLGGQLRYGLECESGMKRSSILVIDPKNELLSTVQSVLAAQGESNRLIIVGNADNPRPVKFFTEDQFLSMREKLEKMNIVLGTDRLGQGEHAHWQNAAMHIIEQCMNVEHAYRLHMDESLMEHMKTTFRLKVRTDNFWGWLEAVLRHSRSGRKAFKSINVDLHVRLKEAGLDLHPDAGVMDAYEEESELMQWQYRMQFADHILRVLADPEVAKVVDMDPFDNVDSDSLDLREAMESGQVALFQPTKTPNSALAARAIKTKWQEGVSTRLDMERPVGLVVDEFQKFITLDEVSGDATFLDTARGYRCNAVYATQSIEALQHALKSGLHAQNAVAAIVANTPSKWFFATKDKQTETTMLSLIPASTTPGTPHILTARPASLLQRGEAYWSLADSRWGRGRADLPNLL